MSESAKTCSLIGVAVVLVLVAALSRPRLTSADSEGKIGQTLFPDWQDPAAAKSLEITNVDETTNSLSDFKVADVDGSWVVPSHDNYPADAKDHVFKAASSIIGLKVLEVVSDKPGDQEEYGVVEPNEKTLTSASFSGFGRLVVIKDAAGKDLASLIVGKEDKSTGENGPSNLRFVRRQGQDRIYRVSLDTDVLTTKFQDWVDTDILALKQHWDINSLLVRDYTIGQSIDRKDDISLASDPSNTTWSIKKITEFKDGKPEEIKLPADEELDSTKINDLKTNLSGLKLANVQRKPASFIEKLKSGKDYLGDPLVEDSLEESGFVAVPRQKPTEVFSAGGDMTVGMKDGVEYTVRFGGAAMTLKSDSGEKKAAAKDTKHTNIERVVFVTARFNPDLIPKPVLEPLPEAKKPDEKKPDDKKTDAKKSEEKLSDVKAPEPKPASDAPAAKKEDKPADGAKPADATKSSKAASRLSGELLALADTADDAKKPDDAKKTETPKAADTKTAEPKTSDKKPAEAATAEKKPDAKEPDQKKPDDNKTEPGKPAAEKPKSDIDLAKEEEARDAERKRIETANRQAQDQYDATVKQGKAHAKELNTRFADWYYMISEDEYKKVHVGLSDLLKKKAGAAETGLGPVPENPFPSGLKLPHP